MSKRVVIAGGSGFIGRALATELLEGGYDVVVLSRSDFDELVDNSGKPIRGARFVMWDGETLGAWKDEVDGSHAVINLAGEEIAQHWNEKSKERILSSRVLSTRIIGRAIAESPTKPEVWINASAIGYYGDRGNETLDESSPAGARSFLVDTCVAWENEIASAEVGPTRKAWVRTGIVLGRGGGFFEPMRTLTKMFVGGHAGSGDQFLSWIHIRDMARLYRHVIEKTLNGPVNGTSPNPCTNRFFMATLRGVMRRPWAPPAPAFLLKLVEFFGGPPASLLLEGQRVLPKVASDSGFVFQFPELRDALVDLVRK